MAADVQQRLPGWAVGCEWLPGECRCGARLIRVECYCGHHVVCAKSSFDADHCPRIPAATEETMPIKPNDGQLAGMVDAINERLERMGASKEWPPAAEVREPSPDDALTEETAHVSE